MTDTYSFFAQNGAVYNIDLPTDFDPSSTTKGWEYLLNSFSTAQAVAAVQNCTVETQFESNDLYAWSTVTRVDTARHEAKVSVNFEYCKFLADDWFKYILDPSSTASLSTGVSIADTTDLHRFAFMMKIPSTNKQKDLIVVVSDVYFTNLPLGGELGEWVRLNLEGYGANCYTKIVAHTAPNTQTPPPGDGNEEGQ